MKKAKIKLTCPDINDSEMYFKIRGNEILFPLTSIKGVSSNVASQIIEERNKKKFLNV